MSHLTSLVTQLKDLEAIEAAAERAGLKLEGAGRVRIYGGSMVPAAHIIRVPDGYDLGFNLDPVSETYRLVTDSEALYAHDIGSNRGNLHYFGPGLARFFQEAAAYSAERAGLAQGYTSSREVAQDGSLVLTLRR